MSRLVHRVRCGLLRSCRIPIDRRSKWRTRRQLSPPCPRRRDTRSYVSEKAPPWWVVLAESFGAPTAVRVPGGVVDTVRTLGARRRGRGRAGRSRSELVFDQGPWSVGIARSFAYFRGNVSYSNTGTIDDKLAGFGCDCAGAARVAIGLPNKLTVAIASTCRRA